MQCRKCAKQFSAAIIAIIAFLFISHVTLAESYTIPITVDGDEQITITITVEGGKVIKTTVSAVPGVSAKLGEVVEVGTVTQQSTPKHLTLTAISAANLRSGPGTTFAVVGHVKAGQILEVIEKNADGTWYQLADKSWFFASLARNNTQSATVPPTHTPQPGPIAPTATPAPVVSSPKGCPTGGCTQYPTWCATVIKGNISYNTGEKIYHVPGGQFYDATSISPAQGERWFCSEDEAVAAGWRRSKR